MWFLREKTHALSLTVEVPLSSAPTLDATLTWSPDGSSLAFTFSLGIRVGTMVIDAKTAHRQWTHQAETISYGALAWSPNGTWLALASHSFADSRTLAPKSQAETLQLWQVHGWKQVAQYAIQSSGSIEQIIWSPDSTRLALVLSDTPATEGTKSLQIYRASDGHLLSTRQAPTQALKPFVRWLAGGTLLATGWLQGELDIRNVDTGISTFHHEADHLKARGAISLTQPILLYGPGAALSPDGKRAAICVLEREQMIIQVWDVSTSRLLFRCQPVAGALWDLTWSPDGSFLAAFGAGQLAFWDASSGVQSFTYKTLFSPNTLIWSPDGRSLAFTEYLKGPFLLSRTALDLVLHVFSVR